MVQAGQILDGKYRLDRVIGRGAMGAVFAGEHTRIKRAVAVKVLHAEKGTSENAVRFEREAQAAGQIGSEHIVEVIDFGTTEDGDRYMVMELLDGETLKERLKRVRRLDEATARALVAQALEGVAAAHAADIVHRDLKPDNLFILKPKGARGDFVKVLDFGISKFTALGAAGDITREGAMLGSPYYMAPEQAQPGGKVDARTDVYALGVVLFEATTGSVPFQADSMAQLMYRIVFERLVSPAEIVPTLDPGFVAIVLRAMARDPAARFASAREMQAALAAWAPHAKAEAVEATHVGAASSVTAIMETTRAVDPALAPTQRRLEHTLPMAQPSPVAHLGARATMPSATTTAPRATTTPRATLLSAGPLASAGAPLVKRPPSPAIGAVRVAAPPTRRGPWAAVAVVAVLTCAAAAVILTRAPSKHAAGPAHAVAAGSAVATAKPSAAAAVVPPSEDEHKKGPEGEPADAQEAAEPSSAPTGVASAMPTARRVAPRVAPGSERGATPTTTLSRPAGDLGY